MYYSTPHLIYFSREPTFSMSFFICLPLHLDVICYLIYPSHPLQARLLIFLLFCLCSCYLSLSFIIFLFSCYLSIFYFITRFYCYLSFFFRFPVIYLLLFIIIFSCNSSLFLLCYPVFLLFISFIFLLSCFPVIYLSLPLFSCFPFRLFPHRLGGTYHARSFNSITKNV